MAMGYVSTGKVDSIEGTTAVSDGFATRASRLKPLSALFLKLILLLA